MGMLRLRLVVRQGVGLEWEEEGGTLAEGDLVDQGKMGLGLGVGAVRGVEETLPKEQFLLVNGEEEKECPKDHLEGEVVVTEGPLEEALEEGVEEDIKDLKEIMPKNTSSCNKF